MERIEITKSNKVALIIGATGLVGGHLIEMLLNSNSYRKVISVGRSKVDSDSDKLLQITTPFEDIEKYRDDLVCDDFFICLGTTMKRAGSKEAFYRIDHNYVINTAHIVHENGASQCFLISAINADVDSNFFYNRVKGQVEIDLLHIGFWSTHIFRPSLLLGERKDDRLLEDVAKKVGRGVNMFFGSYLKKYAPIEGKAVAKCMIKVAQKFIEGLHVYQSDYIQMIADDVERNVIPSS